MSFKSVSLDSHQGISSKTIQMYLKQGDTVDVKIIKLNPGSCIVDTKLFLSTDDPKAYLSTNQILLRYSLTESKTFKVSLDDDFNYKGVSLDQLKKSNDVKHPRSSSNKRFRNWSIIECKKELEIDPKIDVGHG